MRRGSIDLRRLLGELRQLHVGLLELAARAAGEAAMEVLGAAARHREVADAFMACFETPRDFWPWIDDRDAARQFVARRVHDAA